MYQVKSSVPNQSLRDARLSCGWTQAQLADKIGCDTKSVRRWERGLGLPSLFYVRKLCKALKKNASALGLLPDVPQPVDIPEDAPIIQEDTDAEEYQAIFD